jgi:hypothetical protein
LAVHQQLHSIGRQAAGRFQIDSHLALLFFAPPSGNQFEVWLDFNSKYGKVSTPNANKF